MYDMKLPVGKSVPKYHVYDSVIYGTIGGEAHLMWGALDQWHTLCRNRYGYPTCKHDPHLVRMTRTCLDMSADDLHFTYDDDTDYDVRHFRYHNDMSGNRCVGSTTIATVVCYRTNTPDVW